MSSRAKKKRKPMPPWTPFAECKSFKLPDGTWAPIDQAPHLMAGATKVFRNSRYQVYVGFVEGAVGGQMLHLSIKRNDRETIHDWRDLQRIKNELCGPECEAVEIYPAESRLVDTANQFHLWVLPPGEVFPFGFFMGRVVNEQESMGAKQRPYEEGNKPENQIELPQTLEEAEKILKETNR
jgi:hypothetical protein